MERLSFDIYPNPPFRLDLTSWCLRRREENRIDLWDGRVHRRVFLLDDAPSLVSVTDLGRVEAPHLRIDAVATALSDTAASTLRDALVRTFGIGEDLAPLYRFARHEPVLGPLVARYRGMRPPRFPTLFETLLNGFACQQVSLAACLHLLDRLAEAWGRDTSTLHPGIRILPLPEDLSNLDAEALRGIGFSRQKSRYIVGLARQLEGNPLALSHLSSMTDEAARTFLQQLPGIGRWTADYVLLRGLGRWHVFPAGDAGARGKLGNWLATGVSLDDAAVQRLIDSWQPFGGLVYFHLLLWDLEQRGLIQAFLPRTAGP